MLLRCALLWLFSLRPWARAPLCLWGLLLVVVAGHAQEKSAPFQFKRPRQEQALVPFFLQRNLIVVQVKLNGQGPFNFLLDTGINSSLITDISLQRQLGLRLGQRFQIAGAGEEAPLEAYQVEGVNVELRGVQADNFSFLVLSEDILNLSGYVGMPIHGLLGSAIFRSFAVEVQPEKEQLVFRHPTRYRRPRSKRWVSIPLEIENSKPYLTVPVVLSDSLTMPLKLVLDTGAGHALSLETTSSPRLRVPPTRLRTQLGRGLSGYINGYLGRVAALRLGRYQVPSLLTSFPDAADVALRTDVYRNGNLGFELLKRFVVIIDYPRNQLLLRPNGLFRDPFEHDMCGLDIMATGENYRRYLLMKVQPHSPAEAAGLRPRDELLSINLLPASQLNLTQVSRMFHSADGRTLLLLVRRENGELFTTTIQLKRQI